MPCLITLPIGEARSRGELIRDYLSSHPEIKYYLIADNDEDLLAEQLPHLVKTSASYGFSEPEYKRCIELYMKFKSGRKQ